MEIEQGASDCTCKIDHYENKFGIQIFAIFWIFSKKLAQIHLNLTWAYLRFDLITLSAFD
jgi:hypothetical protein